jgi:hypothetical protein
VTGDWSKRSGDTGASGIRTTTSTTLLVCSYASVGVSTLVKLQDCCLTDLELVHMLRHVIAVASATVVTTEATTSMVIRKWRRWPMARFHGLSNI